MDTTISGRELLRLIVSSRSRSTPLHPLVKRSDVELFSSRLGISDEEKFDKPPQAAGDGVKPPHQHFALKSFFFFSFRRSLIFEFFSSLFYYFYIFLCQMKSFFVPETHHGSPRMRTEIFTHSSLSILWASRRLSGRRMQGRDANELAWES